MHVRPSQALAEAKYVTAPQLQQGYLCDDLSSSLQCHGSAQFDKHMPNELQDICITACMWAGPIIVCQETCESRMAMHNARDALQACPKAGCTRDPCYCCTVALLLIGIAVGDHVSSS